MMNIIDTIKNLFGPKTIKVKRLYADSQLPSRSREEDEGWDLYSYRIEDFPTYIKVYTGVAIEPPKGYYTEMPPRSSVYKNGLIMHNSVGVIDYGYRNELIAILAKTPAFIMPTVGDRLVQIILKKRVRSQIKEVKELSSSDRGMGGFGSTGKN